MQSFETSHHRCGLYQDAVPLPQHDRARNSERTLVNPRTAEDISQHAHIYKVLRTEMILIENAYTIKLSDDEMAYLIEIIINLEG